MTNLVNKTLVWIVVPRTDPVGSNVDEVEKHVKSVAGNFIESDIGISQGDTEMPGVLIICTCTKHQQVSGLLTYAENRSLQAWTTEVN